ncbi:MAG: hypothetical protein JST26_09110 [Bacteroidetes bacterium]|nr:hypothetical protein [Bacteroidota bacterium]
MKKLILSIACLLVVGALSAQDNPKETKKADKKASAPAPESEGQNRSINEKALPNKTATTGKQQQLEGDTKGDTKPEEKKTEKKPNKRRH